MRTKLGQWIFDNAELFRHIAQLPALKKDASRILLSGSASSFLASSVGELYSDSEIVGVDLNAECLEDAQGEYEDMTLVKEDFSSYKGSLYDIAISTLEIEKLNTRELTPYLFNLYDSLSTDGYLYISFPDAISPTAMEKSLYPAWYDENEMIYMKYYMAYDVANALSMIGFEVKAIEGDNNNDLIHVVTIIARKK